MNSITINQSVSYRSNSNVDKGKDLFNHRENTILEGKDNLNIKDNSNISEDGTMLYNFLNRIETSNRHSNQIYTLSKYVSEYKTIKKEILAGDYGSDINKYGDLLDNAFKGALDNFSNSFIKSLNETISSKSTMKMSSATLIKYQKQYENGNTLNSVFREENKI